MMTVIKELIEQIGGRERLEKIASWSDVYGRDANVMLPASEAEAMASALLAVLDAQGKAFGCDSCGGNGAVVIDHGKMGVEHMECQKCFKRPPADSAPVAMQPLYIAGDGRIRFKENAIVRHLLTSAGKVGVDLNSIARDDFSDDDRMQFAQLIGYSLGGYGELPYVSDESYNAAVAAAPAPGGDDVKQG